jgi:hypothetical protein
VGDLVGDRAKEDLAFSGKAECEEIGVPLKT